MLVFGATALLLALAPLGGAVRAEPGSPPAARPAAAPAASHPGSIDIQPESVQASVGVPVTLGVRVYDASGALYVGDGTSVFVRIVFLAGSANDPGAAQSFHLSCRTGDTGTCSVTYTPLQAGQDVLCARTGGGRGACDEAVGASEQDDLIDVVHVSVQNPGSATPTAAPAAPTASPAPTRTSPAPTRSPAPPRKTPKPTPGTPPPVPATPRPQATPRQATAAPNAAGTDEPGPTPSPVLVAGGGGSHPSATPGAPLGAGSNGSGGSPAPRATDGPGAAISFAGSLVKPEAAAAVAANFGFPIALMVAVVLFLLLQPRLDERDPKLRTAPRTYSDLLVPFEREIDL